jgi:hypothetical protein
VGAEAGEGVGVGVEEEAAVARADQVQELGQRELGLAEARAARDVGEEGVGDPHPTTRSPPAAATRPSGISPRSWREKPGSPGGGGEASAPARTTLSAAARGRRL